MTKESIEVDAVTADAIPAFLRYEHLSDEELEAALRKELEACVAMTEWPPSDRY